MLNNLYQMLDPIAFSIGPLTVRWYGIAYVLGFLGAALVIWRLARRWRLRFDTDTLLTIMICAMIGIILGARVGYCFVYGDGYYFAHPEHIFAFNMGGMSFHGGLVGGLVAGIVAAKITHIPYLSLADLGVAGAPVGLFFGRIANFINGELWGAVTDFETTPWAVIFGGSAGSYPRHPSQLYEALLEGLVLFIAMMVLARAIDPSTRLGKRFHRTSTAESHVGPRGVLLGTFLVLYGIFRFSVEFVRQPDAQLGYLLGTDWLTMGQVLSVPLIVVGIGVLVWACVNKRPEQGLPE